MRNYKKSIVFAVKLFLLSILGFSFLIGFSSQASRDFALIFAGIGASLLFFVTYEFVKKGMLGDE